jgi:hypothetical protein
VVRFVAGTALEFAPIPQRSLLRRAPVALSSGALSFGRSRSEIATTTSAASTASVDGLIRSFGRPAYLGSAALRGPWLELISAERLGRGASVVSDIKRSTATCPMTYLPTTSAGRAWPRTRASGGPQSPDGSAPAISRHGRREARPARGRP